MDLKHIPVLLCVILCLVQVSQSGRLRGSASTTRSWRESLESLENHDDMVETFTPSTANTDPDKVCMSRHRYESTLRVVDRMKDYMKNVQSYMETCGNLSNAISQRNNRNQ